MKKKLKQTCINCHFADTLNADKEYESIAEMMADDDHIICTRSLNKMDDYDTCRLWKKCEDAKMMFLGDSHA